MNGIASYSGIEFLESRIAPAGLVTVTFAGGVLELTSDEVGSHNLSITALDATTVEISGADGTLFRMGDGAETDTLLFKTPIKSLSVTLGDEQDTVQLAGLNLPGSITIDMGAGDNTLSLDSIKTKGSLGIEGGAGSDAITLVDGVNSVKKNLQMELGDGANSFRQLSALFTVGGQFTYTGGANGDVISLSGSFAVKGKAEVLWGAGTNTFNAPESQTVSFGKSLTFDSTASTSAVGDTTSIELTAFTTQVRGLFQVLDGAGELKIYQVSFGLASSLGGIDVVTGGGESEIYLGSSQFAAKSLTIDARASSESTLTIGSYYGLAGGNFSKKVTYLGGAGDDSLTVQIYAGNSTGPGSLLKADLGDGDNSAQIASLGSAFKKIDLTGGTGEDEFLITAVEGKVGSIAIDNGSGEAETTIQLLNSKLTGQINVINGTDPGLGRLRLGLFNSQIGGLSYTSGTANNVIDFTSSDLGLDEAASNQFTVKKEIRIETGAGNDTVDFGDVANARIGKGMVLDLGDGNNEVNGEVGNFVTKALTVTGGTGRDLVNLSGSGDLGAVKLTLGAGENLASISGKAVPLALKSLTLTSASAAADVDSLTLARIQVRGSVSATFGSNASTLAIDDSIIGGSFFADTGAGADVVTIDTVDSNTGTILVKPVSIKLGDGDDMLTLGGNGTSALLTTKSKFEADGGAGTDTLTNLDNIFAKLPVFVSLP